MTNIILCGGSGTRLWPISRTLMPKQFIKLFDNKSLFQLTVERNSKFCKNQLIVSNVDQYFLALDQLEEINKTNNRYILEPVGRNTAPAIALASFLLDEDDIVLVTPSDHLIKNEENYKKSIERAKELATQGYLVTFGIKPTYPETGYGYIEADKEDVIKFHEKPDLETAKKYLEKGNYYWNSGMFCFKTGVYLEELKKHSPEIYKASKEAFEHIKSIAENQFRIPYEYMIKIPDNSIDYAVMEKSDRVKVVPSDFDWNDIGSFDSLYEELPKDENQNTENLNLVQIDSKNNLIYGNDRKIAAIDIENLIIADTPDALLVCKKGSSQKVKEIVKKIKKDTNLHHEHITVHRPWGTYTVLEESDKYKIKRIVVKPGKG